MCETFRKIKRDFNAALSMDPAATSRIEVVLTYAGFHALLFYRFAHWLSSKRVPFVPRALSQFARLITGIEIHPRALIGSGLFIDHGMGVVIGETTEIGDNVTLFQGVTLGGTGKTRGKRHPTLRRGVVVGCGAAVLGDIILGENVKVGAGSVVVRDVPENCTVVGIPARVVGVDRRVHAELLDHADLIDPIMEKINQLRAEVKKAEAEIRGRLAGREEEREPDE